jgi:hypothetical protein
LRRRVAAIRVPSVTRKFIEEGFPPGSSVICAMSLWHHPIPVVGDAPTIGMLNRLGSERVLLGEKGAMNPSSSIRSETKQAAHASL